MTDESRGINARHITFTLPFAIQTGNALLRLHYRDLKKYKLDMSLTIRALVGRQIPFPPFRVAHVTVERHSAGTPDFDGLVGACKPLIDVLLPQGEPRRAPRTQKWYFPHPAGLGIILDDDPAHLTVAYKAARVSGREPPKTVVHVQEV